MEPRPYARLSVAALGIRIVHQATVTTPEGSTSNSTDSSFLQSSYSCKIKLSRFESQTVPLPLSTPSSKVDPDLTQVAACFYLDEPAIKKLLSGSFFSRGAYLKATVYSSTSNGLLPVHYQCASRASRIPRRRKHSMGSFKLPLGLEITAPEAGIQLHHGWVSIGHYKASKVELHLHVKVDLDPRYIFQFEGEPELSPQIVHVQGNIRQPIFSCKFTRDRSSRSRAGALDGGHGGATDWDTGCRSRAERDYKQKSRKGWLLLIHDLSGSAVAAASMVTPFVPSSGCDRVSQANPGAWLIMKAGPWGEDSWRPWGRLEAWREKGAKGGLGCRFQLMAEGGGVAGFNSYGLVMSETVISSQKGGDFLIDTARFKPETPMSASPVDSPQSSGDFCFSVGIPAAADCGFVMSANVQGEGKTARPPLVQLAMRHVACVEDAAVFMALAAAVDLSMDACLPFSKKLGKSFLAHS